jgi:predicted metal-dependent phosphoesterase TrpH
VKRSRPYAHYPVVLKADLHTHSREDPIDRIPYDARALIDRAAALGYAVLAITLHDRQLPLDELTRYASARGVVVIPGVERTIRGKHALLLNFPGEAERVDSFEELRDLKRRTNGLVIAPHPFYPHPTALGRLLDAYPDVFDAVECNAFYTRLVDFNKRAATWARRHRKPIVGNGDVHRLRQLGRTYSLIDAEPDPDSVCEAVREGRVSVCTEPLTADEAAWLLADLLMADARRGLQRMRQPTSVRTAPSERRAEI